MNWICKLLGHRWEGCRCARCGQTRDTGHRFAEAEGRCEHTCALCGKTEPVPHTWDHCRCARCGQQRDTHHLWLKKSECEQVCRICGQERDIHDWRHVDRGVDRCAVCGAVHRLTAEEIARRDEEWAAADVPAEEFDGAQDYPPDPD